MIPAKGLSEVGRDDGADNPKDRRKKPLGSFSRRDEFGNHSSNEANDDGPENTEHILIPLKGRPTVW